MRIFSSLLEVTLKEQTAKWNDKQTENYKHSWHKNV
jgi:hypothetical protein